jgi:uncharacterized membrane protein YsdA (DUF1294 family)
VGEQTLALSPEKLRRLGLVRYDITHMIPLEQQLLISLFVGINIIAVFITAYDKRKATVGNDRERTPEGVLFFLASIFGALGVYVGMQVFRHKTRRWYFQLGIPLLIVQNAIVFYLLYNFFS